MLYDCTIGLLLMMMLLMIPTELGGDVLCSFSKIYILYLIYFKGDCARSPWGHELVQHRIWKFAQARLPVSGACTERYVPPLPHSFSIFPRHIFPTLSIFLFLFNGLLILLSNFKSIGLETRPPGFEICVLV